MTRRYDHGPAAGRTHGNAGEPAREHRTGRTVVVGLGNPILRDDGVGCAVVRLAARRLAHRRDLAFVELNQGGLRLAETISGYRRAVIVDALAHVSSSATDLETPRIPRIRGIIIGGSGKSGTVRIRRTSLLPVGLRHVASAHDTGLATALSLARALLLPLPNEIVVVAVVAHDLAAFGTCFSRPVARAVPAAVDTVCSEIGHSRGHVGGVVHPGPGTDAHDADAVSQGAEQGI